MEDQSASGGRSQISEAPFDEFSDRESGKRSLHLSSLAAALRLLSGIALLAAVAGITAILLLDVFQWLRPDFTWRLKSAIPLICIGVSYALLQFTLSRTIVEFSLSMAVSLAFILWGVEQFIPMPLIASRVDDVVVFLFLLDLSVVIWNHLKRPAPSARE